MAPQDSRKPSQQEKELEESFEQIDELEMQEIRRQDECEPFETISDAEAQEVRAEERSDRYYKRITDDSIASFGMDVLRASATTAGSLAMSLGQVAKNALVPKQDPSPEELHCPCWSQPEGGWRFCFVESHVRAAIKRVEEGQKKKKE
ncbi:hypothetical protein BKA80DRAFT_253133 [Phyllosticta citrichinensis]